ncbi:hypothetical protein TIFTF001_009124 [Ficus carica]|uniref:Uncharacterized protein n=1 Tax=Ficus carica TaxID=3494 RepID=A0AA88AGB2_FICCA|nr:hypothetical protein TIFTF001_009124 [Ficus carica]
MKEILDPWGPYLPMWNTIFAMSSVIAVSTDPIFLYTLVLDEYNKCLGMDSQLKIFALCSRSVTDIIYIFHIFFLIRASFMAEASGVSKRRGGLRKSMWRIAKKARWSHILFDLLAVLPLPQVRSNQLLLILK